MAAADDIDEQLRIAGAPPDLLESLRPVWLKWYNAKTVPTFEVEGGFIVLKKQDDQLSTYASIMQLRFNEKEKTLHSICSLQGCGSSARIVYNDKVNMGNYLDHLWQLHGGAFLTSADFASKSSKEAQGEKKRKPDQQLKQEQIVEHKTDAEKKSIYIQNVARWLVSDARPFNLVQGFGFRLFSEALGLPSVTGQAVKDAFLKMYKDEVSDKLAAHLKAWLKPIVYQSKTKVDKFQILLPLSIVFDGWQGRNGLHYVSFVVHGRSIFQGLLKPESLMMAIKHWQPEQTAQRAAAYSAEELASFFEEQLRAKMIYKDKGDVFVVQADTASTNIKAAELLMIPFAGCWQHIMDLWLEDLKKCASFKAVDDAVSTMTTALRASDKTITVLKTMQAELGVAKNLQVVPTRPSETRFTSAFISARRIHRLWPAITRMRDGVSLPGQLLLDAEQAAKFKDAYVAVAAALDELNLINSMSTTFLKISAALGSESTYVFSCHLPLFHTLYEEINSARSTYSGFPKCVDILDHLEAGLYRRIAPLQYWYRKDDEGKDIPMPKYFVPPHDNLKPKMIERDTMFNAAAYLDPVNFRNSLEWNIVAGDAEAFYFDTLLKPRARLLDAAGQPVDAAGLKVAANKAQATKEKKSIMLEKKPGLFMSSEAWLEDQQRRCDEIDARFNVAAGGDAAAAIIALDPHGALLADLKAEMALLSKEHIEARKSTKAEWEKKFGRPFDQANDNRRAYWVKHRGSMPLLFLCASVLLTAPAASTTSERAHSKAGIIMSKSRCSMSSTNLEHNLMGYYWLRQRIDELVVALDHLDLDDAFDVPPPLIDDGGAADDAAGKDAAGGGGAGGGGAGGGAGGGGAGGGGA